MTVVNVIDYRLSRWLIINVDSASGSSHRVDVSNAVDISEVNTASVFKVEPEYGDSMSLAKVSNTAHIRKLQSVKSRRYINS